MPFPYVRSTCTLGALHIKATTPAQHLADVPRASGRCSWSIGEKWRKRCAPSVPVSPMLPEHPGWGGLKIESCAEWLGAGISRSQADYHLLLRNNTCYKIRTIDIIEQIKVKKCRTLAELLHVKTTVEIT